MPPPATPAPPADGQRLPSTEVSLGGASQLRGAERDGRGGCCGGGEVDIRVVGRPRHDAHRLDLAHGCEDAGCAVPQERPRVGDLIIPLGGGKTFLNQRACEKLGLGTPGSQSGGGGVP